MHSMKICSKCGVEKDLTEFYVRKDYKNSKGTRNSCCKTCHKARSKAYLRANKDIHAKAMSKWQKKNPHKTAMYYAEYKRRRGKAALKLSDSHKQEMEHIYWTASDLRVITGESYHVDHIVPLKSKHICGLHVPWNLQILPSDMNISKSNSFPLWWID